MLPSLELLVEKVEGGNFRVIIFEVVPDEYDDEFNAPKDWKYHTPGVLKSVTDIIESPQPWVFASGLDSYWTAHGIDISSFHSNVNFGRAKTLATKIKKICKSLG